MATTNEAQSVVQLLDVEQITIPRNVRELDDEHLKRLAASIEVRGLRVPVIVRPSRTSPIRTTRSSSWGC